MKQLSRNRVLIIALLCFALLALSGCVAQAPAALEDAQAAVPDAAGSPDIDRILEFIITLGALVPVIAGGPPLIAVVIDIAKKSGMSPKYAPALSVALNAALFTIRYFLGPEHEQQFDSAINALYALAPYVIALAAALLATVGFHNKFVKAGLGYSKTPRKV